MGNASEIWGPVPPVNVILASPQWQGVCYKSGALLSTFVMAYHCIATFEVMNIA